MRLLLFLFGICFFSISFAQKKEISQAQTYIKSRANLDKAESSMRELLKDSANRRNIKIYTTLTDAMRAQYEAINEKLYLKESLDTASFFNIARRMFLDFESLDSLDAEVDKKGNVKTKYRRKNALYLSRYRQNLYNGGLYFVRHKNYESAYDLLDTYLDCENQPLFTELDYVKNRDQASYSAAAFWAVYSAYKLNKLDSALKYSDIALGNQAYKIRTLQYLTDIYLSKKDTLSYVKTLRDGFNEDRKSDFFFTRLMDYYNDKNELDSAMTIVNKALEADNEKELFLFAKSNLLLNMGYYQECVAISDTLLAQYSQLPDVYYNAGASYINMALQLENDALTSKKEEKQILEYYRKALPYMENYRKLMPDEKDKWAQYLYNIYLKLNMGRQFEEISGILLKMRQ